jgi:hypothetical protein
MSSAEGRQRHDWTGELGFRPQFKSGALGADFRFMRRAIDRLMAALRADVADMRIAVTEIVTELDRGYV